MFEIVEFLEARLAEDEAVARAANGPEWENPGDDGVAEGMLYADGWGIAQFTMYPNGLANGIDSPGHLPAFLPVAIHHIANGVHAARHDPARILREVAAKRALMASHDIGHDPCDAHDAMYESVPCDVILHLAAIYSDHPDFNPDWAE